MEERKYLTAEEVSDRYRGSISVGTLRNWRAMRIGPTYIKIGKADTRSDVARLGNLIRDRVHVAAGERRYPPLHHTGDGFKDLPGPYPSLGQHLFDQIHGRQLATGHSVLHRYPVRLLFRQAGTLRRKVKIAGRHAAGCCLAKVRAVFFQPFAGCLACGQHSAR